MPRVSATERAATQRRLIDAGKTEFAERGLAGARFDEISLAAGHAKGTIYNYFADKDALFSTIVEEWCQQLVEGFVPDPHRSAIDDLLEIARLDVETARKDPELASVVINQVPALAAAHRSTLDHALEPALALLADAIGRGQRSGEIRGDRTPVTLARLFLATLSAIEQEALDAASGLTLDDVLPLVERVGPAGLCP